MMRGLSKSKLLPQREARRSGRQAARQDLGAFTPLGKCSRSHGAADADEVARSRRWADPECATTLPDCSLSRAGEGPG